METTAGHLIHQGFGAIISSAVWVWFIVLAIRMLLMGLGKLEPKGDIKNMQPKTMIILGAVLLILLSPFAFYILYSIVMIFKGLMCL